MRYADPDLCPDCRSRIATGTPVCPSCRLLVRHPLAVDLFRTLRSADGLLAELRTASQVFHSAPVATSAPLRTAGTRPAAPAPAAPAPDTPAPATPAPAGSFVPPLAPYPVSGGSAAAAPSPARTGLTASSVPKILLGLGALCLLVAAIVFLAVSWSALGVGGRTAVLAGFTLLTGAGALGLQRAGLRVGAESLSVVSLGLLGLDLAGAGAAGWLGDVGAGGTALLGGGVVAAAALGLGLVRPAGRDGLCAPHVVGAVATLVAWLGAVQVGDGWLLASHLFTALAVGAVLGARRLRVPLLAWSQAAVAAVTWTVAAGIALARALEAPTLPELWGDGSGWSLLLSAAALLVPGAVLARRDVLAAGAGGAALVVTGLLTLPCLDEGLPVLGLVALGTTAAWVAALAVAPAGLRVVAHVPAAAGSLVLLVLSSLTATLALERWTSIGVLLERDLGVALRGVDPAAEPLLLVPSLLVVLGWTALVTTGRRRSQRPTWLLAAALVAGLGVAATLASYDVPLALPVTVLLCVALGAGVVALGARGVRADAAAWSAVVLAGAATFAALPSAPLTVLVAGAGTVLTLVLVTTGSRAQAAVAELAAPVLLAVTTTGVVVTAGGTSAWLAIPVLLTAGVLALALPRPGVEASAATTALLALPFSLEAVHDVGGLLALWLAVAGGVLCAAALIHPHRRPAAWAGAALLLLAAWVRLADLAVTAPEAYTLPLAAALLGVGGWRMRTSAGLGTAEALLPGLLVATVPSLLWVLADPVSLRALALGAACLLLAVGGAALRWSAPLVVGAGVGAVLVLLEVGPYAGDVPKWVWIGLAGALLTTVGLTWERRLLEVRQAAGMLGRLR